jgi:multisubunit Na+/H+ antiporter MnhE subunit
MMNLKQLTLWFVIVFVLVYLSSVMPFAFALGVVLAALSIWAIRKIGD